MQTRQPAAELSALTTKWNTHVNGLPHSPGSFSSDDTLQGLRTVYSADSNLSKRFSFAIAVRSNA